MRLIRYRIVVVAALAVCLALVGGGEASGHVGLGSGPPTATGTSGAAAGVRANRGLRQQSTRCAQAATPSTRRSPAGGVLGVTEPFSAGIGGGGFSLVIYRSSDGKVTTIDSRETAPRR